MYLPDTLCDYEFWWLYMPMYGRAEDLCNFVVEETASTEMNSTKTNNADNTFDIGLLSRG